MRKFLAVGLAAVMAASLAACGGSSTVTTAAKAAGTTAAATTKAAAAATTKAAGTTAAAATTAKAAGTTAASGGAAKKLTLILRGGTYADVIKKALPEFEKANNCTCEVLDLSFDDLHSKIALDAVNQKGAYDLCMVDGSWMAEFTANKVLANLSSMGYKFDDDIIPATTTICKVGNDIYLAPYFGNVTVMLYNKANIKDAGYDTADKIKSWDDVMKIAKASHDKGKKGYLIRGGSPDNIVSDFIPVLLAHGGWVVDGNNKPTVNTDATKAAVKDYLEMFSYGDTMDKDDIVAAIDGGTATMGIGWPGWYVPKEGGNASYIAIPTKLKADSKDVNTSMYGVWTIGICNNSQNKDLAYKLLQYVMDPKTQLASIENGGVPCRSSCLTNADVLKKYPQYKVVNEALKTGVYRPVIEQWNDFTTIFGTELDNIIKKTKTTDQGLKDAQTKLETLMK